MSSSVDAVLKDRDVVAPTVGTWTPSVGVGAPLSAGQPVGRLRRHGRDVEVHAPAGVSGVATDVVAAGTWVEYGAVLVTTGEGTLAGVSTSSRKADEAVPPGVRVIAAETDGTLYLRPDPSSPAFAPAGAAVGARATIALVEVMKTFTPVRAPEGGTIERVLVGEAASVAAGQPLFWLRTSAG